MTLIQNRRSKTSGSALSSVADGELVLNQADGLLFYADAGGTVRSAPLQGNAPLSSPAFTGAPTAPTPAIGDSSTRLATTGFVTANFATASPLADGTASAGSAGTAARSDHVHPTDATRAKAGANGDITALTGLTTALSQIQGGTGGQPALNDGCCILVCTSVTAVRLLPMMGQAVVVNGAQQLIPAAGLSLSNSGLAASTLYYIYLTYSSGSLSLTTSTTGHVTGSDGREYLSSGGNGPMAVPTSRLVGMAYTSGNGQFGDGDTFRGVASYFNRRPRRIYESGAPSTSSGGNVVLLPIMYLLNWGDDAVQISNSGYAYPNNAGCGLQTQIQVDGTNLTNTSTNYNSATDAKGVSGSTV